MMTAHIIGKHIWVRPLVATVLVAGTAVGAYGLTSSTARAAGTPTVISYALTLANTAGQTFVMQNISSLDPVQLNQGSVDNTMDAQQLKAAATHSAATQLPGSTSRRRSRPLIARNFVIGLVGKTLARATLAILCNGKVCDQLRIAPVYVAEATQTAPPAGSTAVATVNFEFTGLDVARTVAKATLPTFAPGSTTNPITTSLAFANGTKQNLSYVTNASIDTNQNSIYGGNSDAQTAVQSAPDLKGQNVVAISITKGWGPSDNSAWNSLTSMGGLSQIAVHTPAVGWWIGQFDTKTKSWFQTSSPTVGIDAE